MTCPPSHSVSGFSQTWIDLLLTLEPRVHLRCNPFRFINKETEAQSGAGTGLQS